MCAHKLCTQGEQGKEGEVGLKRRICRAQVKYLHLVLGTVHVSIQVFFYRDGNL